MIDLPEATHIHQRLPKEAFYQHLSLTKALKNRFITDVDKIYVEWSLTKENLHLEQDAAVKEILILRLELKKPELSEKMLETIARQNPHKLVFLLCFAQQCRLAIFCRKLYQSDWRPVEQTNLRAQGFSVEEIWDNLIAQIALPVETSGADGRSIEERLERQDTIQKLQKQIARTEAAVWKETQPKKRFALYETVQDDKKKLEEIKHG